MSTSKCPALPAKCFHCSGVGHFTRCCFSDRVSDRFRHKEVNIVNTAALSEEKVLYLGKVAGANVSNWEVTLDVENTPVHFKIDTGPDVTVLGMSIFLQLSNDTLALPIVAFKVQMEMHQALLGNLIAYCHTKV